MKWKHCAEKTHSECWGDNMGDLTQNFSVKEFAHSDQYPELAKIVFENLTDFDKVKFFYLAAIFLEAVRTNSKHAVAILSGKRNFELNNKIGGALHSDHLYLEESAAVDFFVESFVKTHEAFDFIRHNFPGHCWGQLIGYPIKGQDQGLRFIHLSMPTKKHQGEVLLKIDDKYVKL